MKQIFTIPILALCFTATAQETKPNFVGEWFMARAESHDIAAPLSIKYFELQKSDFENTRYYNLKADTDQLDALMNRKPGIVSIAIPYGDRIFNLDMARVDIVGSSFQVNSKKADPGVQYRGIVNGNLSHIASMNLTSTDKSIYFSTDAGNFVVTQIEKDFVVYNDQVVRAPIILQCETPDEGVIDPFQPLTITTELINKVVKVYFECDYAMYQSKGSNIANVTNYVIGFFSQIATLYANENINIQISEIYVWTTPDPYQSYNSPSAILTPFRAARGTTFNGNLAHFLTTRNIGGGVAYVNTMCNKAYAYGVSRIYTTYSTFPAYSWTINVVAHELGHTIGSPHTQSCSWGSALDNCYTPEGSCSPGPAPINGGTIMSYCHLTNYGINFNNGFGLQPGNLLRTRVSSATCLDIETPTGCSVPASLGTTNITTNSATLNWAIVSGATSYTVQYKVATSSTWITLTSTTATNKQLSGLSANTVYNWTVKADCSAFASNASFTTTSLPTGCATPSSLSTTNITQTSATFNWSGVSGANTYTAQYRLSTSGTWLTVGTTSGTSINIGGLSASSTYVWSVKADCSQFSTNQTFTTLSTPPPNCLAPTGLSTTTITSTSARLRWGSVSGALNYTVQYRLCGTSSWITLPATTSTNRSLSGLSLNTSYTWQVKTNCSVYSTVRNFTTL